MNEARYYPTLTRMPSGKIVVSGGQANDNDPNTSWIKDVPFEVNPSITNLQAPWSTPVPDSDYFLQNYPFIYPVSASELLIAGGEMRSKSIASAPSQSSQGLRWKLPTSERWLAA